MVSCITATYDQALMQTWIKTAFFELLDKLSAPEGIIPLSETK